MTFGGGERHRDCVDGAEHHGKMSALDAQLQAERAAHEATKAEMAEVRGFFEACQILQEETPEAWAQRLVGENVNRRKIAEAALENIGAPGPPHPKYPQAGICCRVCHCLLAFCDAGGGALRDACAGRIARRALAAHSTPTGEKP